MNYETGAPIYTSPLYSVIVSWVRGSMPPAIMAAGVSAVAYALILPAVFLAARALGGTRGGAWVAALVPTCAPLLVTFGLQCQPDALNALWCTATVAATAWFVRKPGWTSTLVLGAFAALAPLVREHGILMAAAVLPILALVQGSWETRVARLTFGGAAILAAPRVVGAPLGVPWSMPWFERVSTAATNADLPGDMGRLTGRLGDLCVTAMTSGNPLYRSFFHIVHTISEAPDHVFWALAALAVLPGLRRAGGEGSGWRCVAPLVALGTLAPCAVMWTLDRHTALAVPVGAAVLAAVATGGARLRLGVLGLGILGVVSNLTAVPSARYALEGAESGARAIWEFSQEFCPMVEPGDLAASDDRTLLLYCPLPAADPPTGELQPYHWKTWALDTAPDGPGWVRLNLGKKGRSQTVYRLLPELVGEERPCHGSVPIGLLSYQRPPPRAALRFSPPCRETTEEERAHIAALPTATEEKK